MKRALKVLALVLTLTMVFSCAAFAEEKAEDYMNAYFGISLEDELTLDAFNAALEALDAAPIDALTLADMAVAAVRIAGMEELALTYINDDVPEKAANVLAEANVSVDEAYAPYIACALDLGLVDADADFSAGMKADEAIQLLYDAASIGGKTRRYIGRVSDEDIIAKLHAALGSFVIFDEETLTNLGTEIVLRGATTGYNLKYAGYDARFMDEYTIKYGHSDYAHAAQLLALLSSEGFDAYVQIEPKVSVYEYMIDWGEPGEPTPLYAVKQVTDDRYLCYAVEYDMMLEFDSVDEKEAFHGLIETYAKKYDDSFDADGNLTEKLLTGAWWQPLYSSTTEMENEEFELLYDNIVYDESGMYSIHPFSLPNDTEAIAAVVAEVAPELSVSLVPFQVNPAFYRYITGADYQ